MLVSRAPISPERRRNNEKSFFGALTYLHRSLNPPRGALAKMLLGFLRNLPCVWLVTRRGDEMNTHTRIRTHARRSGRRPRNRVIGESRRRRTACDIIFFWTRRQRAQRESAKETFISRQLGLRDVVTSYRGEELSARSIGAFFCVCTAPEN